jgi:hypothetical protein
MVIVTKRANGIRRIREGSLFRIVLCCELAGIMDHLFLNGVPMGHKGYL